MSSYLTSILTTTTTRYASLKQSLLPNENDGDTEDDTHISRVLRAYYTEKGRPFPPWLPPDPKAPQPPPTQPAYLNVQAGPGGRAPAGGVLSDLWDPQPQPGPGRGEEEQFSNSLRRGRRGGAAGMQPHVGVTASAPPGRVAGGGGGFVDSYQPGGNNASARPLPSQRAGSYQSQFTQNDPPSRTGSGSSAAGASAQERLKARLWGGQGRAASPPAGGATSGGGAGGRQSPYPPPPSVSSASSQGSAYDRGGRNPYAAPRGGTPGGAAGTAGYVRSGDSGRAPYVGASSPWSTGEDDFSGGSGGGGNTYGRPRGGGREEQGGGSRDQGPGGRYGNRPVGLPSGPRMR